MLSRVLYNPSKESKPDNKLSLNLLSLCSMWYYTRPGRPGNGRPSTAPAGLVSRSRLSESGRTELVAVPMPCVSGRHYTVVLGTVRSPKGVDNGAI